MYFDFTAKENITLSYPKSHVTIRRFQPPAFTGLGKRVVQTADLETERKIVYFMDFHIIFTQYMAKRKLVALYMAFLSSTFS